MTTTKMLYRIMITTHSGLYELPGVDLDKYRDQLHPQPYGNPCLQIINEELSVLSITWDRVQSVTAFPHAMGLVASETGEVLWRSVA